jgi:hypothetical protein
MLKGFIDGSLADRSLRIFLAWAGVILLVTAVLAAIGPLFCKDADDASLFWKVILVLGIGLALQFPMKDYEGTLEANLRCDLTAGLDLLTLNGSHDFCRRHNSFGLQGSGLSVG